MISDVTPPRQEGTASGQQEVKDPHEEETNRDEPPEPSKNEKSTNEPDLSDEEIEGISPVAKKWMTRNHLASDQLSAIFSLGGTRLI